jgi:hypothetical protein
LQGVILGADTDTILFLKLFCPRSSVDRAKVSGTLCAGSIPAGGTKNLSQDFM